MDSLNSVEIVERLVQLVRQLQSSASDSDARLLQQLRFAAAN
jgi:hypothetical protein